MTRLHLSEARSIQQFPSHENLKIQYPMFFKMSVEIREAYSLVLLAYERDSENWLSSRGLFT